ncbi:MAG: FliH/SctL family protein [Candidatus Cloacimonetes bacterium]|nr:FliH/SctL family protein [Candidatus Cloacimonadota bacterium]
MHQNKELENTPASYVFDITPGLEVRNAEITDEYIAVDKSVFTDHQICLISHLVSNEVYKITTKEISRMEKDFHNKLTAEKEAFEIEKEKFSIEREGFEAEKKNIWMNGNQAGIKQTQNQLLSKVTQLTEQLKKSIEALQLNTDAVMQYHKEDILQLIMKITRKILNVELQLNPEIVLQTVKKCLEYTNEKNEMRVLVNPKDWTIVSENLKELDIAMELPEKVDIVASENIEQGGCRVEFKSGSVDADIDSQFNEIQRKLLRDL